MALADRILRDITILFMLNRVRNKSVDRAGAYACPLKRMVRVVALPHGPKVIRAELSVAGIVQLGAPSHPDVRVSGLRKAVPERASLMPFERKGPDPTSVI